MDHYDKSYKSFSKVLNQIVVISAEYMQILDIHIIYAPINNSKKNQNIYFVWGFDVL